MSTGSRRVEDRRIARREGGAVTISFVVTLLWTLIVLVVFLQMAVIGYTWQVTGYAAYASARSRIVGALFNDDYKKVGRNVMRGSLPDGWGSTWVIQELPLNIGVLVLYGKSVLGIPVPVVGRAQVPYSKLNPTDPAWTVWDIGDNN